MNTDHGKHVAEAVSQLSLSMRELAASVPQAGAFTEQDHRSIVESLELLCRTVSSIEEATKTWLTFDQRRSTALTGLLVTSVLIRGARAKGLNLDLETHLDDLNRVLDAIGSQDGDG